MVSNPYEELVDSPRTVIATISQKRLKIRIASENENVYTQDYFSRNELEASVTYLDNKDNQFLGLFIVDKSNDCIYLNGEEILEFSGAFQIPSDEFYLDDYLEQMLIDFGYNDIIDVETILENADKLEFYVWIDQITYQTPSWRIYVDEKRNTMDGNTVEVPNILYPVDIRIRIDDSFISLSPGTYKCFVYTSSDSNHMYNDMNSDTVYNYYLSYNTLNVATSMDITVTNNSFSTTMYTGATGGLIPGCCLEMTFIDSSGNAVYTTTLLFE